MRRDILHFRINSFFASVEQNKRPGLKGKPVVIAAPKGNSSGVVVSVSGEAARVGVVKDMSLRQAQRTCPGAVILKADYASYKLQFNAFLDIASKFSPLLEPDSLESAFLDVSGCCSLFGNAQVVAEAIARETYRALNLGVSIGYAPNKLLAKFASGMGKKLTRVDVGAEDAFLAPIGISELSAVDAKIRKRLMDLGVSTIGQLAQVSEASLVRQFGSVGAVIKKQALGTDYSPVKAAYPPEIIKIEHMFPFIANEPAQIIEIIPKIADLASAELKNRDMLVGSIGLIIVDESKNLENAVSGSFAFKKPNDCAYSILESLEKLLESTIKDGMEIFKIEVVLSDLDKGEESQLCLLGDGERKKRLRRVVEAINGRFGEGKVFAASALISSSGKETYIRLVA